MHIIGQENIASMFGVSARTITEWQASGMPIAVQGGPGVPGEYNSDECIRWMVDREVRKVQGPEAPKDRLSRLQGDELEMKLERERGKLIDATAVEPVMRAAIVAARERIRNEPARLAIALEGKTKAEREILLRELFGEVLSRLSQWQQADAEDNDDDIHERAA